MLAGDGGHPAGVGGGTEHAEGKNENREAGVEGDGGIKSDTEEMLDSVEMRDQVYQAQACGGQGEGLAGQDATAILREEQSASQQDEADGSGDGHSAGRNCGNFLRVIVDQELVDVEVAPGEVFEESEDADERCDCGEEGGDAARAPAEFSATVQPECSAEESQAQGGVDLHGLSAGQDGSEERNVADPSAEEDNQTDADGG